jgi:cytochrome c oxidase subunit 2
MGSNFIPLFPDQASTLAMQVDSLYLFLVAVTVFFTVLVFGLVVGFAIHYRKERHPVAVQIEGSAPLEFLWSAVPLAIAMVIFFWGAVVYFNSSRAPREAMEVYVVGKQWMWKIQHPTGQREINQLHVPVGRTVRLTMISQDVIHSFYVPAFRVKRDVFPGHYSYLWFQATKTGTYHLFCGQYCGTKHSAMIGEVIVMEPADYQKWLSGDTGGSMASNGERLFTSLGCISCHTGQAGARGPTLNGVFGNDVKLSDGRTVKADESYIRESVLNPQAKIVAGYQPIMPTFQGTVNEESLQQLLAFIKSLPPPPPTGAAAKK